MHYFCSYFDRGQFHIGPVPYSVYLSIHYSVPLKSSGSSTVCEQTGESRPTRDEVLWGEPLFATGLYDLHGSISKPVCFHSPFPSMLSCLCARLCAGTGISLSCRGQRFHTPSLVPGHGSQTDAPAVWIKAIRHRPKDTGVNGTHSPRDVLTGSSPLPFPMIHVRTQYYHLCV